MDVEQESIGPFRRKAGMSQIKLLRAAVAVVMSLDAEDKTEMIECLDSELDREGNVRKKFGLDDEEYIATVLSNGWVAVYREDSARFRQTTLLVFDLLPAGSALGSGGDLFW
jgi:hypothetical protein